MNSVHYSIDYSHGRRAKFTSRFLGAFSLNRRPCELSVKWERKWEMFDIIKRPEPWTTIVDYAVYDCFDCIIECPRLLNMRHVGYSNVFDRRCFRDEVTEGVNRAEQYTSRKS